MIKTNLGNVNTFEDLLNFEIKNITTLTIPEIKLTENFINSFDKFINLIELDISKNTQCYLKKIYDYGGYISKCHEIKECNIYSEQFASLRKEILLFVKIKKLNFDFDLIPQIESCIKQDNLIKKFEDILPALNIEKLKTHYISKKCISRFTKLKELEINYIQFTIFKSYNEIFKVISNNKNMESFIFNKPYLLNKNVTFEDAVLMTRDFYDEEETMCAILENLHSLYPSNVFDEEYVLTNYIVIDNILYDIYNKWISSETYIYPLLSTKLKCVQIHILQRNHTVTSVNILDYFSLNNQILKLIQIDNVNYMYNSKIQISTEELHCSLNTKNINTANLPINLKKIKIMDLNPQEELIKKKFEKIPFGCKIVDKNDIEIQL